MVDTTKKEKDKFASKEALDELNCDHSHATVHKKKGTYEGSPGALEFRLGSQSYPMDDVDDEDADGPGAGMIQTMINCHMRS